MILYSDELTRIRQAKRDNFRGELRMLRWNFANLPIGNIADVLVCGKIYKGETVMEGRGFHTALGVGTIASYGIAESVGSGPTDEAGPVTDPDQFCRPESWAEAGETWLLPSGPCVNGLLTTGVLWEATQNCFLVIVNSGAPFAENGVIRGRMLVAR